MTLITGEQYKAAFLANKCINCDAIITGWKKFLRLFWAPVSCPTSMYWKVSCSYKCWGKVLDREMEELQASRG